MACFDCVVSVFVTSSESGERGKTAAGVMNMAGNRPGVGRSTLAYASLNFVGGLAKNVRNSPLFFFFFSSVPSCSECLN